MVGGHDVRQRVSNKSDTDTDLIMGLSFVESDLKGKHIGAFYSPNVPFGNMVL